MTHQANKRFHLSVSVQRQTLSNGFKVLLRWKNPFPGHMMSQIIDLRLKHTTLGRLQFEAVFSWAIKDHMHSLKMLFRHLRENYHVIQIDEAIVTVISDTMGPLPKGVGHIMRMTLLTSEFRDLDFTRKPILLLSPPSGGVCFIGVTTTPITSTSSAPTPPVKGLVKDGGISGHPVLIGGVMVIGGGLSNR